MIAKHHADEFRRVADERLAELMRIASPVHQRDSGLYLPYDAARRENAIVMQGRVRQLFGQGALFRISQQRLFEKAVDRFGPKGVSFRVPASSSKEFLIGDVPALPIVHATGTIGPSQGVGIENADEIVMPVSRRLMVVIGNGTGTQRIDDAVVDSYNKAQVVAAPEHVHHHPSVTFGPDLTTWISLQP